MTGLPSGTVTFLFTDIEGSTRLFQQHPDAMQGALARHHALLQRRDRHASRPRVPRRRRRLLLGVRATPATRSPRRWPRSARCTGKLGRGRRRCACGWACTRARGSARRRIRRRRSPLRARSAWWRRGTADRRCSPSAAADRVARRAAARRPRCATSARTSCAASPKPEIIYQLVAADLPSEFPPLRVEDVAASSAAPLQQLVRGRLVGRAAELQQLRAALGQRAAGARASGPALGRAGRGQDAPRAGADRARAARAARRSCAAAATSTRRRRPTCRSSRRSATGRAGRAPEQLRAALGADRARDRQARARRSRRSSGRSRPTRRCRRARSGCACSTTSRASCSRSRPSAACCSSSTTCTGPTRARSRCCITCCATCATTACWCSPRTARSSSTARTRWPSALVDWNRERLATRIALGRLSRADTGALLAALFGQDSVSDEFVAALYRETEGNPFFVEEVIKSLIEQGQIYREQDGWDRKETHELAIPQSVKEAIGRRLDAAERADGRRAAHRRRARQDLRVPANWPPSSAAARTRCSTRSTRRAPRSSSARTAADRRVVRRRRQLRLHPRQDPRGAATRS